MSFVPTDRFPGYGGGRLSVRFGLLLRDGWSLSAPSRGTIFDKYTRAIDGRVLALEYARGGPLDNPDVFSETIARDCPIHQSLVPYYPIHNAPDCEVSEQSPPAVSSFGYAASRRRNAWTTT